IVETFQKKHDLWYFPGSAKNGPLFEIKSSTHYCTQETYFKIMQKIYGKQTSFKLNMNSAMHSEINQIFLFLLFISKNGPLVFSVQNLAHFLLEILSCCLGDQKAKKKKIPRQLEPSEFNFKNQSLLEKNKNFGSDSKTKHLDIKIKWLKEMKNSNQIEFKQHQLPKETSRTVFYCPLLTRLRGVGICSQICVKTFSKNLSSRKPNYLLSKYCLENLTFKLSNLTFYTHLFTNHLSTSAFISPCSSPSIKKTSIACLVSSKQLFSQLILKYWHVVVIHRQLGEN
ncbi:hypothetical protein VP01_5440g1, partial [Puccinia sorghi]